MPRITRLPLFILVGVCILLRAGLAPADVVELKNGQRVEGTLKQLSLTSVSIEVGGQVIILDSTKVRTIHFGSAPPSLLPNVQPTPAQDALRALKDLQSATGASLTYRDYGPRVSDTKIRVDRYLELPEQGDAKVRAAIALALNSYVALGSLWGNKLNGPVGAPAFKVYVQAQDAFQSCKQPGISQKIADFSVMGSSEALPAMLECASERVNEVARLIGER
jgi:hypothetical protein